MHSSIFEVGTVGTFGKTRTDVRNSFLDDFCNWNDGEQFKKTIFLKKFRNQMLRNQQIQQFSSSTLLEMKEASNESSFMEMKFHSFHHGAFEIGGNSTSC